MAPADEGLRASCRGRTPVTRTGGRLRAVRDEHDGTDATAVQHGRSAPRTPGCSGRSLARPNTRRTPRAWIGPTTRACRPYGTGAPPITAATRGPPTATHGPAVHAKSPSTSVGQRTPGRCAQIRRRLRPRGNGAFDDPDPRHGHVLLVVPVSGAVAVVRDAHYLLLRYPPGALEPSPEDEQPLHSSSPTPDFPHQPPESAPDDPKIERFGDPRRHRIPRPGTFRQRQLSHEQPHFRHRTRRRLRGCTGVTTTRTPAATRAQGHRRRQTRRRRRSTQPWRQP